MKRITLLLLVFAVASSAYAGVFDWQATGFLEGSFYPPHNEFDPNPGIAFPKRIVARYGLELNCEMRPKMAKHFLLFFDVRGYFGNSFPQVDYDHAASPIVANAIYGAGYGIGKHVEIRITHGEWKNLGGYVVREKLAWNAIQVRYNFKSK